MESASATATADGDGPDLLGRAVETLEKLAEFFAGGAARDRGAVAPPVLQALLGMEESTPMGSARDWEGTAGSDSADNPLWGAPRIHGELLKLGLTVSQATVSQYMLRPRRPPLQAWRAFLMNHARALIVRRQRPDLAQAYDVKRHSHADEEGVLHDVVNGLEIEIPTRRIARRMNALVKSGETKSPLEALEVARREAPGIAKLLDEGVGSMRHP
jgi:hypothetical protein